MDSCFTTVGGAGASTVQTTEAEAATDGETEGSWLVPLAQTTHFEVLAAGSPSLARGCEWKTGSAAKSTARKMIRIGIRRIRCIIQPGRS